MENVNEYHQKRCKPCPFCGKGPDDICGVEHGSVKGKGSQFFVQCVNCAVRMEQDRRDKVIGMWNNRLKLDDSNPVCPYCKATNTGTIFADQKTCFNCEKKFLSN